MPTFSELPIFIENLIQNIPQDVSTDIFQKAEPALEECLQLLTILNKAAFYAANNDSANLSISDLAEASASLSELSGLLAQVSGSSSH
ncbi:hypothetical protein ACMXYO_15405 [Neptuniibacter sp. QD37_6]|uniref:hypothetical protein n=1 Tax=Neptuniibacter sp. QD37_6 TaxID=3398210 RepID=UPI0039F56661